MRLETSLKMVAGTLIILLIIGIASGAINQSKENALVYTNCVETNLVVIDSKGHIANVYDCSEQKEEHK
jgi:hypothetical protein